MEADVSGPSLAAPQFSRAVPVEAAGLQPAGDTLGCIALVRIWPWQAYGRGI